MTVRKPSALPTTVRPMPVLPAVPSTTVPPGRSVPRLHGVLDDEERGAVLHGLAGVHELGLAEDGAAGLLGGALELDEGRAADRGGHAVGELQGPDLLLAVLGWISATLKMGTRPRKGEPHGHCRRPFP